MATPEIKDANIIKDLEARIKEAGSQLKLAKQLKIKPAHFNDIFHRRRAISEAIAKKLGYERVVTHVIRYRKL